MPALREPPKARISKATVDRAERAERQQLKGKTGDAYQNFQQSIGLGTENALTGSTYGFNPITRIRVLLEWIYRGSWLGGMAVDIIADDMTRGGIEIQSTMPPEDIETIQQALVRLGVWAGLNENIKWARLYGGSLAVMMIDGQDVSQPLNIDRIAPGAFKGLLVLDRWMTEPDLGDLVTEMGPDIGKPKYYRVTADAPAFRLKRIHYSRCIRFDGIKLPYWQKIMENMWGLSVFERLYDRMIAFDSATMGMAQLVYKSYLRTYKLKGLRKILSEGGPAQRVLTNWTEMTRKLQGNEGITLIDGDDEFIPTTNGSFSGISEVVLQIAQQLSGALQMPLTRLFGQSPAGLNATGESDLRTYYDGIKQQQELTMRMPVEKVVRVTAKSEGIKIPDKFSIAFRELWQLSESGKSEVFARDAGAVIDLEASGIMTLAVAMQEIRQLSKTTGRGSNITDKMIKDAEDAPPRPREMGGENEQGELPFGGAAGENKPKTGDEANAFNARYLNIPLFIEAPRGTSRWLNGPAIAGDYGYIPGVPSGEPDDFMDVFVGADQKSRDAWVIDQFKADGTFEEHKVMLGFNSADDAAACWDQSYAGANVSRGIPHHMTIESLTKWLIQGEKKRPIVDRKLLRAVRS